MRRLGLVLAVCAIAFGCDDGESTLDPSQDAALVFDDAGSDGGTLDAGAAGDASSDGDLADGAPADAEVPELGWLERFGQNGPSNVGFAEDEISYTPIGRDEARTLRVVYWYPTDDSTGNPAIYARVKRRAETFKDAALAPADAPRPVFVFSHGSGGISGQTYTLMERFASHGWLVVAMDHTGNTIFDNDDPIAGFFELRPQDVSNVLDYVLDLPAEHFLAGVPDADRIFMSGHSFGGYTTLAMSGATYDLDLIAGACEQFGLCEFTPLFEVGFADPRIKAAAPMTPAGFQIWGAAGLAEVQIPTLLITAARDETLADEDEGTPIWNALAVNSQHRRMQFLNAGHFSFTDFCFLLVPTGVEDGCTEDFTPPEEVLAVTGAYMMAWAHRYVLGELDLAPELDSAHTTEIMEFSVPE